MSLEMAHKVIVPQNKIIPLEETLGPQLEHFVVLFTILRTPVDCCSCNAFFSTRITNNVQLFKKLRDIIYFCGTITL